MSRTGVRKSEHDLVSDCRHSAAMLCTLASYCLHSPEPLCLSEFVCFPSRQVHLAPLPFFVLGNMLNLLSSILLSEGWMVGGIEPSSISSGDEGSCLLPFLDFCVAPAVWYVLFCGLGSLLRFPLHSSPVCALNGRFTILDCKVLSQGFCAFLM
ncbi:hypothetical protein EVAR_85868_1 [Eumeta japonica]|uniref:Uncharacterized protein n=1 Tax=Eumeta variegata TaxID=151549 RepID=A0A4C2A459_EUMVA|nr:hypothetical protein EVAR_85868_1 [Eumeta japonica]